MNKAIFILIAFSIIILSGCSNPAIKNYPRYYKQKVNISNVVVACDFAISNVDMFGESKMDMEIFEKNVISFNDFIQINLRTKGYNVEKVYDPTFFEFENLNPIYTSIRTLSDSDQTYPQTINKTYFYNYYQDKKSNYSEILPVKIDTNDKILRTGDTITEDNIDVAGLFLISGVEVSFGRKATLGIISGVASTLLTLGAVTDIITESSNCQVDFLLINRKTNEIIYRDTRIQEPWSPKNISNITYLIQDIIDDLPTK